MTSASVRARPLITVVTSCFNHEPFLDDYVAGLLDQTYDNVELIVFDDGSTDGSWEKLQEHLPALRRKLTRVVVERHENIGPMREVQLAVELARGELLCILESDDYYLPTKLEEDVRFLQDHPDAGVVHSDIDYILPEGLERAHWRSTRASIPTGHVFEQLLVSNFVMTCSFCCRIELFRQHADYDRYIRNGYGTADWATYLDLARHARFGYIDKPLARYRVRSGSLSRPQDPDAHFAFHRSLLRMRLDYAGNGLVSPAVARQVKQEYHRYIYRQGLALGRPDDHLEGLVWLRENCPGRYDRLRHRVAARAVRFRPLWRAGRRVGAVKLGWRVWRAAARSAAARGGPDQARAVVRRSPR
jgi:glycosyltransferase involved in cell wall biosynthesis